MLSTVNVIFAKLTIKRGIVAVKVKFAITIAVLLIFLLSSWCSLSKGLTDIEWTHQMLDGAGQCTSIALDSSDTPYISYFELGINGGLKCAIMFGNKWDYQIVDPKVEFRGKWSSIAIDSADKPHIAYIYYRNWTQGLDKTSLKYASWTGSTWNIQTIDLSDNLTRVSLCLDSEDNPCLSYSDQTSLKYASWTGSTWNIQTIDTPDNEKSIKYHSIALDSAGTPHIAYSVQTSLKYASWTGSTWNIQTIDIGPFASCSLQIDSKDNPHVSYHDMSNLSTLSVTSLKYASWTGVSWDIQVVDSKGHVGGFNSLALDQDDNPCIAHYKSISTINITSSVQTEDGDLLYAKLNGANWVNEVVISTGEVGQYCSLALDSQDNPHIACWAAGNNRLVYSEGSQLTITSPSPAVPELPPIVPILLIIGMTLAVAIAFKKRALKN